MCYNMREDVTQGAELYAEKGDRGEKGSTVISGGNAVKSGLIDLAGAGKARISEHFGLLNWLMKRKRLFI